MNIFKKIYARTYQFIFKLAIPILPYRKPIILDNTNKIKDELIKSKINSVIIVTDKTIINLGLANNLISSLENNGIKVSIYDGVIPNPTTKNVSDAKDIYIKNNCRAIIAFGGGSPMDCAKALGAVIAKPKSSLNKMAGILKVRKKIPPLFAIPSTAGTGSETTLAAVIVDEVTRHKYAINDFPLIPKYAILDSSILKTLPPSIISSTGMDALVHAIEAYIGRSTIKSTRRDSLEAIKLIFENITEAYEEKTDKSLRNMLYASHYAGRAFSKSYVGYVHALSHALGGKYNVAHGLANSVILPHVLECYDKSIYKKFKKIAIYTGLSNKNTSKEECFNIILNKIKELNNIFNMPKYFDCILKEDLDELVKHAYNEAYPLYPVPVLFNKQELKNIYLRVMKNE